MKLNHARTAMHLIVIAGALAMSACTVASTEDENIGDDGQAIAQVIFVRPGEIANVPCGVAAVAVTENVGGAIGGVIGQGAPVGQGPVEQGTMGKGVPQ